LRFTIYELLAAERGCVEYQPQRFANRRVLPALTATHCGTLRLVFQTQPRSSAGRA
jgi:hypothetical protein